MSRRYGGSEVVYDDRRERDYVSRGGSRYDDRYTDQEIEFRRSAPPVRERDDDRSSRANQPAFLREGYGRTSGGEMVLRAREREDFEFVPRRRRSPSPEDKRYERESIIIRRDESEPRKPPPRREKSREREEIIIRRDERERSRPPPPPPPPPQEREREEIVIRREERSRSRPAARDDRETERIVIRRREDDDRRSTYEPPSRQYDNREREEIIIRREEDERSYAPPRRDVDYALVRPKSRERERSRMRREEDDSEEIIIRRDRKEEEPAKGKRGRSTTREREEIIITRDRSVSRSPSPSPAPSARTTTTQAPAPAPPPPEPQIVYAPQIHQEVVTHHRHIDHGYEVSIPPRPRPVSRPPSPPTPPSPSPPPPPARERSEERIEIRRTGERNGRSYDEDIIIDRNEGSRSVPPPKQRWRDEREVEEEAEFYMSRDVSRRPEPQPQTGGDIGRRYGKTPDPRAGLWTEITKDLVIKEAINEMGYEYEETDEFYYIIAYLKYEDVARLVGLSEDIRKDRRKRVKEIEWETRVEAEQAPRRLAIEGPPARSPRSRVGWDDERYIEREIVYRGGRPPPPPGWRR